MVAKRTFERAKRAFDVCRCAVCLATIPITFEQQHHTIPQAAGGATGPTRSLCPNCHHNLHRVADMLASGRAGLADDSARIQYPDPKVRERLFDLAKTVVEYMRLKRDGRIDTRAPVNVIVPLPVDVKLAAQIIANEHVGPNGRRLGLASWIAALIKRDVYARYPHLQPSEQKSKSLLASETT